ncbi:carboxylesterase/lipase family protein [Methylocapsa sp. S129]|uniref:carboxylesterase/lipase family protein n=1 Tax=Methylocapsa sp. S129 TaxID=1641869 RepID=UPI00131E8E63|nr:carboxylesterase family protein [Methylocapsa sp. S129]
MPICKILAAVALAAGLCCAIPAQAQSPIVHTASGDLAGSGGDIRAFKGVPYAAPPIGPLRWRPPEPIAPWTGVRDATRFGADCMQKPLADSRAPGVSEDCLTLNIWAPAQAPQQRLPVMVWVYGGGFVEGSASLPLYDGEALARKGVVLITLNYRTGVFGFLAHRALAAESPQHSAGNYGVLDVIEALRWIKQNIGAFGGDLDRVTIFGESAGASILDMVLVSPLSEGLMQRAILESPGAMRPLSTLPEAEAIADVAGPDLAVLRAMPASEVLALNGKIVPPVRHLTTPRALGPIRDGWVVPRTDTEAFASGLMRKVPLIVGGNSDEGRAFVKDWPIHTGAEARSYAEQNFGGSADAVMSLYRFDSDASVKPALAYAFGDTQFNYGVRGLARGMSAVQPKTWRYLFTHAPAGETIAPTHSEEIDYVFGNFGAPRWVPRGKMNAADRQLSDAMMEAWVRFAATGDPNGGNLPRWPAYDAVSDPYLEFGDAIAVGHNYRTPYLDFVQGFLTSLHAAN